MSKIRQIIRIPGQLLGRLSDRTWLIIRFIIFPLIIFTPFLIGHVNAPHCFEYISAQGYHVQGIGEDDSITYVSLIGTILFIVFAVTAFRRRTPRSHIEKSRLVLRQIGVSLAAILVSYPFYEYVWHRSQGPRIAGLNVFCDSQNQLHMSGSYQAQFGWGIDSGSMWLLAGIYLIIPVIHYYKLFLSNRHVGTIRKKELFK